MTHSIAIAAIVLAGGLSARMGQDKALISLGTETLLQHTCQVALACAHPVYVVTPWPDRYQADLPPGVNVIPEVPLPGESATFHGPLVGFTQGLEVLAQLPATAQPAWVLVLACDLPNLTLAALQPWIGDLTTLAPGILAYLPKRQGRWEPLCGFYRLRCIESLQTFIAAGGRSFQRWCAQSPVAQIELQDETLLVNLNTPQDLAQWQR
ncbi:molybdenum cofactor guanylyltransferase [Nodosilinea sp. P-1105]|uniref:molybdenum cofactor guanylyltransferase n=1 Tax=Nodosilinea sp. P-1105 TaxID=2546229 RepID=UPI00146EF324|nr:molybdenum cofactor guanylyltransferase [Nodosilinea sp. P-1105]NMF85526.1 molybdenum cofactor guanylyltransferase [Nodosilinea sp. P-1105]